MLYIEGLSLELRLASLFDVALLGLVPATYFKEILSFIVAVTLLGHIIPQLSLSVQSFIFIKKLVFGCLLSHLLLIE
jgi:hypothetical protein